MEETDVKKGILLIQQGERAVLIFITDGIPTEFRIIDQHGVDVIEHLIDKIRNSITFIGSGDVGFA